MAVGGVVGVNEGRSKMILTVAVEFATTLTLPEAVS